MSDTTAAPETTEKRSRTPKPLTEVGVMAKMEDLLAPLSDEAAQRVVLYFASRVGFDIRLLVRGEDGRASEAA